MAGFDLSAMLKDVPKSGTIPELRLIPFDKIEPDPKNGYSMDGIEELAGNIETVGLLDPLVVLPETDGVYPLLSGHRRHAAIDRIINGGNEMFSKGVPCIVRANREPQEGEDPQVTELLNRLTLLMANSDNRKKTSADDMREAEGLEEIVAKLADLGFEFPGRRRDWVAKLSGMSKSKLGRLKVIKDKLEPSIRKAYYDKGKLKEDSAYKLAQLPPEVQRRTVDWFRAVRNAKPEYWYAGTIEEYGKDIERLSQYKCPKKYGGGACTNQENLQNKVWAGAYRSYPHCAYGTKCCSDCDQLSSCSRVCERLKPKADKLRAEKRAQNKAMKEAEEKAERPFADRVRALWLRFGNALDRANMETEQLWKITGNKIYQLRSDEITALERGEYAGKVKSGTVLPYANNTYLSDVDRYIKAAEALGCSLDYLFLRTDVPEINTGAPAKREISVKFLGWLTSAPPDGVKCWAKFMGDETEDYSMLATYSAEHNAWYAGDRYSEMATIDQTCIGWWPFPEDNAPDIPGDLTPIDPAPTAWQTGKPSRPGLYAVRFKAGLNAPGEIHNFAKWDGFQWHAERSGRVIDDMIAVGWSPLPEVEE